MYILTINEYSENNEITLYHASPNKFKTLNISKIMPNGLGFYFSTDKNYIKKYGKYLYEYNLTDERLLNLYEFKDADFADFIKAIPLPKKIQTEFLNINPDNNEFRPFYYLELLQKKYNIVQLLSDKGYNGVSFYEEGYNTVVLFELKKDNFKIISD